jgi:hypothetical protein
MRIAKGDAAMSDVKKIEATKAAAEELGATKDEDALELMLGMIEKESKENPALADDLGFRPEYGPQMGLIDNLKSLGRKIATTWSRQLHAIVCGEADQDSKDREKILTALNMGEAAVIGAVAAALIGLSLPAALAAAAAPLIVKRFIWPAKDVLCEGWKESLGAA